MTRALDQHTTPMTTLGVRLPQDTPDFMLTSKVPRIF
jgi:hypothetical protein